jgi:hypothetical protein
MKGSNTTEDKLHPDIGDGTKTKSIPLESYKKGDSNDVKYNSGTKFP